MSTKHSPRKKIEEEALKIAASLKQNFSEAKEYVDPRTNKIVNSLKFGIVMDDKVITIRMPFHLLRESTIEELQEFFVNEMLELKPTKN